MRETTSYKLFQNKFLLFLMYVSSSFALGYSLPYDLKLVAFVAIFVQFIFIKNIADMSIKWRVIYIYIGQTLFMFGATLWFRNIIALGWQDIGGLSPSVWLMALMLFASAVVAISTTLLLIGLLRLIRSWASLSSVVYLYALFMVAVELVRGLTFSLLVKSNGTTVEPVWNIYSVASLNALPPEVYGTVLGFWGTSFMHYLLPASIGALIVCIYRRTDIRSVLFGGAKLAVFTFIIYCLSFVRFGVSSPIDFQTAGIADNQPHNEYLLQVADFLSSNQVDIVVLPEYSNLIHPITNTTSFSLNQDYQDVLKDSLINTDTYIVGTEDEIFEGKRYAQTYILDADLEKIDSKTKQFLIPGGEYTTDWVADLLKRFDEKAVNQFISSSERYAKQDEHKPKNNEHLIGLGACSTLLTPYSYRQQVGDGALVLTSNVSFEQFADAPEYASFVARFSSFISGSLNRPMVVGAKSGQAKVFNAQGQEIANSDNSIAATANVSTNSNKTLYAKLGDTTILLILATPLLSGIAIKVRRVFIRSNQDISKL